jgi:UDP-2,3-diacylglucosamine hydrolase
VVTPAVAVIADAHLGGPGGAPEPLLRQLDEIAAGGCRHLVLLGDLFQVWVGRRRFLTPEIERVVAALRRLRAGGVRVDYVEGNRDFFLAGSPCADAFDRVAREVAFDAGSRRCLAVHGDGLNDRDRQYLFWRWLSKSALSRLLVSSLPAALARRAVGATERRLAETNFKHKRRIPEEAIVRYGERRLRQGFDLLLLGHFHEERRWRLGAGEIWLLEAWFSSRRVEWVGEPPRRRAAER